MKAVRDGRLTLITATGRPRRCASGCGLRRVLRAGIRPVFIHEELQAARLLVVELRQFCQEQGSLSGEGDDHDSSIRPALFRTDEAALFRPFYQTHHGMDARLKKLRQLRNGC